MSVFLDLEPTEVTLEIVTVLWFNQVMQSVRINASKSPAKSVFL